MSTIDDDRSVVGPELYRGLVERSVDGILVHVDGEVVYANPALRRMLGCGERQTVVGCSVSALLPPPLLQGVALHIVATKGDGGLGAPVPTELTRLDGVRVPVEVVAVPFVHGDEPAAQVVIREIGGRRTVDAAIASRDAALRLLLSQMPAVVWSTDREHRVTSAHGQPCVLGPLGRPVEGTPLSDFFAPAETDVSSAAQRRALEGVPSTYELTVGDATVEVHTEPLRGERGAVVGSLGLAVDVTARRRLEAHLREAQKLDALGRIAAGVAHEVNNMMMIVLAHADLLADGTSHDRAGSVDAICTAAERAATIAHQVLAFGRRQILTPQQVDLNELVARTETLMRRPLGETIELVTRLATSSCVVEVDAGQLEQVLVNLLLNARDALPRGGTVTVGVERRDIGADRRQVLRDDLVPGAYVVVTVSDDGPGMDTATLERVFEPFFTTKPKPRTGLGLSTAYGIVRQSRGTVVARSTPGRGASFEIWLPAVALEALKEERVEEEDPRTSPAAPTGLRVLLVEDEAGVRQTLAEALGAHGLEVVVAVDGRHAIELLDQMPTPPDIVVTDVVMPRLGGRDLVDILAVRAPEIAVLLVSGYGDDEVAASERLPPATPLLRKPFHPKKLIEAIRALVASPR